MAAPCRECGGGIGELQRLALEDTLERTNVALLSLRDEWEDARGQVQHEISEARSAKAALVQQLEFEREQRQCLAGELLSLQQRVSMMVRNTASAQHNKQNDASLVTFPPHLQDSTHSLVQENRMLRQALISARSSHSMRERQRQDARDELAYLEDQLAESSVRLVELGHELDSALHEINLCQQREKETSSIEAKLSFLQTRCDQLETENRRLRSGRPGKPMPSDAAASGAEQPNQQHNAIVTQGSQAGWGQALQALRDTPRQSHDNFAGVLTPGLDYLNPLGLDDLPPPPPLPSHVLSFRTS